MADGNGAKPAIVYVSWGGTGRSAAVREAMRRAADTGHSLHYLAVLDRHAFADLDRSIIALMESELDWLLDAQLSLIRRQLGADDLPVAVTVRSGDVAGVVADVTGDVGPTAILVGAPVPVADHAAVRQLCDEIEQATGCPVTVVQPAD